MLAFGIYVDIQNRTKTHISRSARPRALPCSVRARAPILSHTREHKTRKPKGLWRENTSENSHHPCGVQLCTARTVLLNMTM